MIFLTFSRCTRKFDFSSVISRHLNQKKLLFLCNKKFTCQYYHCFAYIYIATRKLNLPFPIFECRQHRDSSKSFHLLLQKIYTSVLLLLSRFNPRTVFFVLNFLHVTILGFNLVAYLYLNGNTCVSF